MREGRRKEFAALPAFKDEAQRSKIPDPNAESTFTASIPQYDVNDESQQRSLKFHRRLLALRRALIIPALPGCRSVDAIALDHKAVLAAWQLGNGNQLTIAVNFGETEIALNGVRGELIFASDCDDAAAPPTKNDSVTLPASCARAWINKV